MNYRKSSTRLGITLGLLGLITASGCNEVASVMVGLDETPAVENEFYGPFKIGMTTKEVHAIIRQKTGRDPELALVQVPGFESLHYGTMHLMLQDGRLFHVMHLDGTDD